MLQERWLWLLEQSTLNDLQLPQLEFILFLITVQINISCDLLMPKNHEVEVEDHCVGHFVTDRDKI